MITFFLIGLLFRNSGSPDLFMSHPSGKPGVELSGFLVVFPDVERMEQASKSLFDAHYKLSTVIRRGVLRQLRWFIPFAGVTIAHGDAERRTAANRMFMKGSACWRLW